MFVIQVSDPDKALEVINNSTYGVKAYKKSENEIVVEIEDKSGLLPQYVDTVAKQLEEQGLPPNVAYEMAAHNQLGIIALLMLLAAGGIGIYYFYKIGGAVSETITDILTKMKPLFILAGGSLLALIVYWGFTAVTPKEAYELARRGVYYGERVARAGYRVGKEIYRGLEKVPVLPRYYER